VSPLFGKPKIPPLHKVCTECWLDYTVRRVEAMPECHVIWANMRDLTHNLMDAISPEAAVEIVNRLGDSDQFRGWAVGIQSGDENAVYDMAASVVIERHMVAWIAIARPEYFAVSASKAVLLRDTASMVGVTPGTEMSVMDGWSRRRDVEARPDHQQKRQPPSTQGPPDHDCMKRTRRDDARTILNDD
jgi:hypothetical protein